jgi:AraC-like DNA-binding protein
LRRVAVALRGGDLEGPLAGKIAVASAHGAGLALVARLESLLRRTDGGAGIGEGANKLIEEACVRWLLQAISPPGEVGATEAIAPNRRLVVRRAEDYMHAHLADPVTMLDLCEVVDVSERTLHYAFQETFDMSPMAYFKSQRLNVVRHALKVADPHTTVAEVAQRWGFWHTGNFAADYYQLFGELPSQTLGAR